MYMYTLLSFYIYTHNRVLKQDLTNSIILCTLVTMLFGSSAIFVIFVRAPLIPQRHVFLLKRIAGKNGEEKKMGLH